MGLGPIHRYLNLDGNDYGSEGNDYVMMFIYYQTSALVLDEGIIPQGSHTLQTCFFPLH